MNQQSKEIEQHLVKLETDLCKKMPGTEYIFRLDYKKEDGDQRIEMNQMEKIHFESVSGRVEFLAWVSFENSEKGYHVISLFGNDEKDELADEQKSALHVETEGAYFYVKDKTGKHKLSKFERNSWYSISVKIDLNRQTYALYIDGCAQVENAELINSTQMLNGMSYGSKGGIMHVKKMELYRNGVAPIEKYATGQQVYDVRELGVCADGRSLVTTQLQKIIERCHEEGGGIVYFKEGTFLTGMLQMKSNVSLYIDQKAVIKGVLDINQYERKICASYSNLNIHVEGPQKALIYGEKLENVSILGGGTIDGSGDFYGAYQSETERPSVILFVGCRHCQIRDIYICNSGMWTMPLVECDDVYIADMNMNSCWYPNRDGIDLCDCHHVLIERCSMMSDDDTICYKSGSQTECNEIFVRDTFIVSTMANGIKFGTCSYGGFRNCYCHDCIIKDNRICAICVESVDGGIIENLMFQNIEIANVATPFYVIIGDKGRMPKGGVHRIGSIRNLVFKDIKGYGFKNNFGSYIGGYFDGDKTSFIENIMFDNVKMSVRGGISQIPAEPAEFGKQYPEADCFGILPGNTFYIRHGKNISFENCCFDVEMEDVRETVVFADVLK